MDRRAEEGGGQEFVPSVEDHVDLSAVGGSVLCNKLTIVEESSSKHALFNAKVVEVVAPRGLPPSVPAPPLFRSPPFRRTTFCVSTLPSCGSRTTRHAWIGCSCGGFLVC